MGKGRNNSAIQLKVLKKVNHSEWVAPAFIIPKKNGSISLISYFRELTKERKGCNSKFPNPRSTS